MKVYQLKGQLWLYKQNGFWRRVRAELKIIAIILLWVGILAFAVSCNVR